TPGFVGAFAEACFTTTIRALAGLDVVFPVTFACLPFTASTAGRFALFFVAGRATFLGSAFLIAAFFTTFRLAAGAFTTFLPFFACLPDPEDFDVFFEGFVAGLLCPFGRAFAAVFFLAISWFSWSVGVRLKADERI